MCPEKIELNGCIERIFTVTDTGDMSVRKPECNGYSADMRFFCLYH